MTLNNSVTSRCSFGLLKVWRCRHRKQWIAHIFLPHFTHIQSTVFCTWVIQTATLSIQQKAFYTFFLFVSALVDFVFFFNSEIILIFSSFHLFYIIFVKVKFPSSLPWNLFAVTLYAVILKINLLTLNCSCALITHRMLTVLKRLTALWSHKIWLKSFAISHTPYLIKIFLTSANHHTSYPCFPFPRKCMCCWKCRDK